MPQLIAAAVVAIAPSVAPWLATAIGQVATSLLLTAASNALLAGQRQSQPKTKSELSLPTEKPAYRFVYGRDLAVGSPAPIRVRDDVLIGCWILNSRPSAMTDWTLYLDKVCTIKAQ